jgi:hypothetical protein
MDISKLPELVDKSGYGLMMESYESQPLVFPRICDVRPFSMDEAYGTKGSVIVGGGRLLEREDGQEIEAAEMRSGPTWYLKNHQWSRRLDLPKRMLDASDAVGRIQNLVGEYAAEVGRVAALQKDEWVADVLQQGTLTAGNATYFDGSFPNNADPSPAFIYDGLPFFDTAHTQTIGGNTFSNHDAAATLTDANLQSAKVRMKSTNAFDDKNERVLVRPNTLIVPPGLERTAKQLLGSDLEIDSAQNNINVHRASLDLIVWDFLDDAASSSAWWMCEAGMGLRVYDSGAPVIETSYDPLKKCHFVTFEFLFGAVVTNWRYWYNANKAAA